ncbi:hypothetical protein U1Q18_026658 [Sarracenia purpurea var. burkii]
MRAGACAAAQQTLTAEAASVLKQSLILARRRGHAQVTPLHVAATLLTFSPPRPTIFKTACLNSADDPPSHHHHHHQPPSSLLHSRALELCFNVALNRLSTTPSPLFQSQPSLSNALIAALKRAQAHQRRGCIDQHQHQQQPILAIKVEIEQLILSILDDPSVSRVMREAGFSSTLVKRNLERESSPPSSVFQCYINNSYGGLYSSPSSPSPPPPPPKTHFLTSNSEPNPLLLFSNNHQEEEEEELSRNPPLTDLASVKEEDVKLVFEVLLRKKKRRNPVILGDSVSITGGLVTELMDRVKKGGFPDELKPVHFIKFQFSSAVPLRLMRREEVEVKLTELKRKVDSLASGGGGGVIIYTGNLMKWTNIDETGVCGDDQKGEEGRFFSSISGGISGYYNPIDHLVEDVGRLLSDYRKSNTFKVWLMATADYQTYMRCQMKQPSLEVQWSLQAVSLPSCGLGLSLLASSQQKPSLYISSCTNTKDIMNKGSTQLPHWLQSQATEIQKDDLMELRKKWNIICQEQHQNIIFPESNSISLSHLILKRSLPASSLQPRFRRQQSCHIEFSFSNGKNKHQFPEPNLDSLKKTQGKEVKITLALGNSQFSENGKLLEARKSDMIKKLQEDLPWQSEVIPSIVEALVEFEPAKKETWLLIHGNDSIGKRRLANGIAEYVFGSVDLVFHMKMRESEDKIGFWCEKLERALRDHENLLVMVEDVDFADTQFIKFLADGFEIGKFGESGRENEGKSGKTAIFILTKGDSNHSTSCGNGKDLNSVIQIKFEVSETIPSSEIKRKTERELPNKAKKYRKTDEKEITCPIGTENEKARKEFSRQSSSNTLDLNIEADEGGDNNEAKTGDISPVSSDLTRETGTDLPNLHPVSSDLNRATGHDLPSPYGFLERIENRFIFDRNSTGDSLIKQMVLSRIKWCFEEVFGSEGSLSGLFGGVEEKLLEELLVGFGSFVNNLFDKWLKEVFQRSLETVRIGGKEGMRTMSVRVCLGSKGMSEWENSNGFMGSKLPKKIQISFMG